MDGPEVIVIVLAAVSGLIWLIRLEGRINVADALHKALEKELKDDVAYIRARIDTAINGNGR